MLKSVAWCNLSARLHTRYLGHHREEGEKNEVAGVYALTVAEGTAQKGYCHNKTETVGEKGRKGKPLCNLFSKSRSKSTSNASSITCAAVSCCVSRVRKARCG